LPGAVRYHESGADVLDRPGRREAVSHLPRGLFKFRAVDKLTL
jgi:hypothetical protein